MDRPVSPKLLSVTSRIHPRAPDMDRPVSPKLLSVTSRIHPRIHSVTTDVLASPLYILFLGYVYHIPVADSGGGPAPPSGK